MKRVLVTGANGFIGRQLCPLLARKGWHVIAAARRVERTREVPDCAQAVLLSDIGAATDWVDTPGPVDAVVHLAARTHVMRDTAANPLEEFRRVNTLGTLAVARAAARMGASLFLFVSTIKVNGERTGERPFSESSPSAPADPYAVSKWEAEEGLRSLAHETGMNVAVLRPPLVYGPGVKGNFHRLMTLIRRRLPLPFASVSNRRSLVGVGNLVSAIERRIAAQAPAQAPLSGTLLVSDDRDLSTPQLVTLIGAAMGIRPMLFPCPPALLLGLGRMTGRANEFGRITESLSIDCTRIKQELGWRPPFSVEEGIADSVQWFVRNGETDLR